MQSRMIALASIACLLFAPGSYALDQLKEGDESRFVAENVDGAYTVTSFVAAK